jgi:hypothetical protein
MRGLKSPASLQTELFRSLQSAIIDFGGIFGTTNVMP